MEAVAPEIKVDLPKADSPSVQPAIAVKQPTTEPAPATPVLPRLPTQPHPLPISSPEKKTTPSLEAFLTQCTWLADFHGLHTEDLLAHLAAFRKQHYPADTSPLPNSISLGKQISKYLKAQGMDPNHYRRNNKGTIYLCKPPNYRPLITTREQATAPFLAQPLHIQQLLIKDPEMIEAEQLMTQGKVTSWQSIHDLVVRKITSLPKTPQ